MPLSGFVTKWNTSLWEIRKPGTVFAVSSKMQAGPAGASQKAAFHSYDALVTSFALFTPLPQRTGAIKPAVARTCGGRRILFHSVY